MSHIGEIAVYFLYVRDQMKIYHWQTKSFARHKSSDSFVDSLTEKMDKFIETIQGNYGKRLTIPKNNHSFNNETDTSIIKVLKTFRDWLSNDLPKYLDKKDTELFNIRDDMISDVNQTLYLFTFE